MERDCRGGQPVEVPSEDDLAGAAVVVAAAGPFLLHSSVLKYIVAGCCHCTALVVLEYGFPEGRVG